MKIPMVLTSHDILGNTGRKTGFWLEEFAAPYFVFRDAGVSCPSPHQKVGNRPSIRRAICQTIKRPPGSGSRKTRPPKRNFLRPSSSPTLNRKITIRFSMWAGTGPMWDLAESPVSIALLESFYNSGKPIALVCHSPGVLRHVTYQGAPLVKAKRVTGFTNGEEEEMHLTNVVPLLVEDELMRLGATFEKRADWQPLSVVDGLLITGQNPVSSTVAAQNLVNLLAAEQAA